MSYTKRIHFTPRVRSIGACCGEPWERLRGESRLEDDPALVTCRACRKHLPAPLIAEQGMNAEIQDAVTLARDADEALENEISAACARLSMATTQDQAHTEFVHIRVLIAQRSPDQVARLERIRGLRK